MEYVTQYDPPEKRRSKAQGGVEERLTEASIMLAMARYILDNATEAKVFIHPDGEHAKRFDIPAWLGTPDSRKPARLAAPLTAAPMSVAMRL